MHPPFPRSIVVLLCRLGWLVLLCSVVQNCQTRPASDRLQCHRSIRTSTLPLDNKHHPILLLVTAPCPYPTLPCRACPVLFWLAVHCLFFPLSSSAGRAVSTTNQIPPVKLFESPDFCLVIHPEPLDRRPPESSSLRYLVLILVDPTCLGMCTHHLRHVSWLRLSLSTSIRLIADPRPPLFAFRVRLADPPPKPGSTSPPISAGAWAGPANKPICRRLIAHCNRDAHLNLALPAATATALPVLAAETISVAFTHSSVRASNSPFRPAVCLVIFLRIGTDPNAARAPGPWLLPGPLSVPGFALSSMLFSTVAVT